MSNEKRKQFRKSKLYLENSGLNAIYIVHTHYNLHSLTILFTDE